MKTTIEITIDDKRLCQMEVTMNSKQAIQIGESMGDQQFQEHFAISIMESIMKEVENSEEAALIYDTISTFVSIEWQKYMEEHKTEDTQQDFDEFFPKLLTSRIKFIPLL